MLWDMVRYSDFCMLPVLKVPDGPVGGLTSWLVNGFRLPLLMLIVPVTIYCRRKGYGDGLVINGYIRW